MDTPRDPLILLGRRTERLLFGGMLIVALALVASFISRAALDFTRDNLARALGDLALLIEGDLEPLQSFYDLEKQKQKLAGKKKSAEANGDS